METPFYHRVVRASGGLLGGLADLVLPGGCAGCGAASAVLCPRCRATLEQPLMSARPPRGGASLPPVHAVAPYAGPVRAALLAHKERGRVALVHPLGVALARAVTAAWRPDPAGAGPVLVPVPSQPSTVRRRGRDPMRRLAVRAAAEVRAAGVAVQVAPVLRQARAVRDQAGLTAPERQVNLRGALVVTRGWVPLVTGRQVVVVDDVLTTGATLAEATRALEAVGTVVVGAAVVAVTVHRGCGK